MAIAPHAATAHDGARPARASSEPPPAGHQ
jgi:hypothetical protein